MSLKDNLNSLQRIIANASKSASVAYKNLDKLDKAKRQIVMDAGQKMVPIIRGELEISWGRSGMHSDTGDLHAAAVTNSQITFEPTGFSIRFQPGTPERIIKYGAAWNYGAVRSPGGARLRKSIKKAEAMGASTGAVVTPQRQFYLLTPDQMARLQAQFLALIQSGVDKVVR